MNTAFSRWRSGGLQRLRDVRAWSGSIIPIAGVFAAGWIVADRFAEGLPPGVAVPPSGSTILAQSGVPGDWDRDALNDVQELVLGTSPYYPDSDGDGFYDVEELARRSDPAISLSVPLPSDIDLGMTARGENGELRIIVAAYLADGEISDKYLEVGFLVAGRLLSLPPSEYLPGSITKFIPAADPTGLVFLIDFPFNPGIVSLCGEASVFVTLSDQSTSVVLAAASVDLASTDGIPTLKRNVGATRAVGYGGGGPATAGAVYIPISVAGGGDIPLTWAEAEICYQESIVVGIQNGILTHEVISAECIEGWDARCRSDCGSSVGESFQTFDPLALIGG